METCQHGRPIVRVSIVLHVVSSQTLFAVLFGFDAFFLFGFLTGVSSLNSVGIPSRIQYWFRGSRRSVKIQT